MTAAGRIRKSARVIEESHETHGKPPAREAHVALLGVSPAMIRLRTEIRAVARSGFRAVLLQGESGVGKEVVAENLRRASPRAVASYEVFDCPAVPEDHLESELFGTVRGAFPGAIDKRGALERAHGGTIFFDEIAGMRRDHQAKILRVIEGKTFRRVGGTAGISVDVAVIAAAHEDLAALAAAGKFRHDLYYRLVRDGMLMIPPLRERPEDIVVLVRHYVNSGAGCSPPVLEPGALERLAEYDWPGNVRQLYTVLRMAMRIEPRTLSATSVHEALGCFTQRVASRGAERLTIASPGAVAERNGETAGTASDSRMTFDFHAITARTQRRALIQAYQSAAGNKTAAGILLGFHLSPGDQVDRSRPVPDGRRNLALRKFRYWCARLGVSDAMLRLAGSCGSGAADATWSREADGGPRSS